MTAVTPTTWMHAVARATDAICASLDRHKWYLFTLVVGFFALCWVGFAIRIPFFNDEVLSVNIVGLPTFGAVIEALRLGYDLSTPSYWAIVRCFCAVFGTSELAIRLPSIAGICVMCAGVYAFALNRYPAPYALVAMLFAADAARPYGAYARPYGIELGFIALALVCWQAAAAGVHRRLTVPLLAVTLSGAVAMHMFAIFVTVPLMIGELVRWYRSRRLDWAVVTAICIPALVLIPHRFLFEAGKQYSPHFLAKATLPVLMAFFEGYYTRYLLPLLVVLIPLLVVRMAPDRFDAAPEDRRRGGMLIHEWAMVIALTLSPLLVFLVAKLLIGVFVDRYVLWGVLGLGLVVGGALFHAGPGNRMAAISASLVLAGLFTTVMLSKILRPAHISIDTRNASALLPLLPADPYPVLFPSWTGALVIWHYAKSPLRERLIYPVDPVAQLKYLGADTDGLLARNWRNSLSFKRPELADFLRSNRRFLVLGEPADWLARYLQDAGYASRRIAGPATGMGIYEWEAPRTFVPQ
jgi:hypothetical protein